MCVRNDLPMHFSMEKDPFLQCEFPCQLWPKRVADPIGPVWCGGEVAVLSLHFHAIKQQTNAAKGLK